VTRERLLESLSVPEALVQTEWSDGRRFLSYSRRMQNRKTAPHVVSFRMTDEERLQLEAAAILAGESPHGHARRRLVESLREEHYRASHASTSAPSGRIRRDA
jgi:hypothetical protein